MKQEQRVIRWGAAVILLATLLRLCAGNGRSFAIAPETTNFLLYAATGKHFQIQQPTTLPPEDAVPDQAAPGSPAVFTFADAELVTIKNHTGYDFDKKSLLVQPLDWQLTGSEPTVLILHSHGCESFENTEGYIPSADYRTTDGRYNMVSVGAYLTQRLQAMGIGVIHDTTLHDYPSYNDAYPRSQVTISQYLEQYPSICLVLDLHRDAYLDAQGNQASSTLTINGQKTSRLMILTGTDAGGTPHDNWQENLATGLKLHATLEKLYPGLCRPLTIRSSAFNQFLSPGALLIEVGTAGDTRQNALAAADCLAQAIGMLIYGSQ